ncbi:hypothetical protein C0991_002375 [Blastosporella zonata]|nr:hypothetical protein C0991_002375 [Blastosporella zonata]
MAETLADYVASQDELLQEAALALPHEFSKCTYTLGPIRPYDASTEQETMIQCLMCEDWFHESCCNLREKPHSKRPSPEPLPEHTGTSEERHDDDARSEGSSDLPPGLIPGTEYESFICGPCASRNKTLVRWAGTPGITMVVRDAPTESWRRLIEEEPHTAVDPLDIVYDAVDLALGTKRPLSPSNLGAREAKRLRVSPVPSSATLCLAPDSNPIAQKIYEQLDAPASASLGAGDLFLSENFRDGWCRCASCLPSLEASPCLLKEEETYEPPEDPDSGLSLEELGMRALGRLPRDKAIDGIHAFNGMRDNLVKYLRPFAQEGKVVSETDVREFFASLTEAGKKNRRT